jgi:hypothetical protein
MYMLYIHAMYYNYTQAPCQAHAHTLYTTHYTTHNTQYNYLPSVVPMGVVMLQWCRHKGQGGLISSCRTVDF